MKRSLSHRRLECQRYPASDLVLHGPPPAQLTGVRQADRLRVSRPSVPAPPPRRTHAHGTAGRAMRFESEHELESRLSLDWLREEVRGAQG